MAFIIEHRTPKIQWETTRMSSLWESGVAFPAEGTGGIG